MLRTGLQKLRAHPLQWLLLLAVIFALGVVTGHFGFWPTGPEVLEKAPVKETKRDVFIDFLLEIYEKIKENYWQNVSDAELVNLFKIASEKFIGPQPALGSADVQGLEAMWSEVMRDMSPAQKKEFVVSVARLVLANLAPPGRSSLYTTQQKKTLQKRVQNINPETGQIEPTVFSELVRPDIFYIHIKKFSPTTFDEFKKAAQKVDNIEALNTLILDLRGNEGGSIDILPYFLGPFIGPDQYAYEFFHQGERFPYKTQTGWLPSLVRYKKVVVLVDGQTQSAAELMAATLKKYNVGVLIGTQTRGWGTVEKVFELENQIDPNEKYSIFLVHSLTLGDDGQPIEGRGVEPVININSPNWQKELFAYFHYEELSQAVKEIWESIP